MNIQILIRHRETVYDVTPVLQEEAEWRASILGKAGSLKFSVVRDGVMNFTEGDRVMLFAEGENVFTGWVMTKERTSEQIISVTAYDQMFYLVRNKATYVFQNQTAVEMLRVIAADYGLETGELAETGWVIPARVEEGVVLIDILLSALQISGKALGKEFFLFDKGGKLMLKERKQMLTTAVLRCDGGISEYHYVTDISRDTVNAVKLYHAGRKETERLALKKENRENIEKWGRLEEYRHVPYVLYGGALQEIADGILRENGKVKKHLTVENINGDQMLFAGNSVWMEIQGLAEISLNRMALIESCTHIFRDGAHITRMDIRIEEE